MFSPRLPANHMIWARRRDPPDHDTAVFNAFKVVETEIRLRAAAGPDDIGVALVSKAMSPAKSVLAFSPVAAEQEAVHALYRGAIGLFRNPLSHRYLDIDSKMRAFELLTLASLLMRLLDEVK